MSVITGDVLLSRFPSSFLNEGLCVLGYVTCISQEAQQANYKPFPLACNVHWGGKDRALYIKKGVLCVERRELESEGEDPL